MNKAQETGKISLSQSLARWCKEAGSWKLESVICNTDDEEWVASCIPSHNRRFCIIRAVDIVDSVDCDFYHNNQYYQSCTIEVSNLNVPIT